MEARGSTAGESLIYLVVTCSCTWPSVGWHVWPRINKDRLLAT